MGVGLQNRVEKTYSFPKSKDAANKVLKFENDLGTAIDSYIADLVKKNPTVGKEKLKTIAQECKASLPVDYSASLTQETDSKLKDIADIDAKYATDIKPCTSSTATLLPACKKVIEDAEAKLKNVISDSEQKTLAGFKDVALNSSKVYLEWCFQTYSH